MLLFDTHTHLNDAAYQDDLEEVIGRAEDAGVRLMNVIGYDLASSAEAVRLAKEYPLLRAVIGIHPHDADQWDEEAEQELRGLLEADEAGCIVGIGEIGLDYHFDERHADEVQLAAFKGQMKLAYDYDLPFVVHDRDAHQDSIRAVRQMQEAGLLRPDPGVFHCYSGSAEFAEELLKLGFYLGLDGPVTFKNARRPVENAKRLPAERLLIETDCPYLTPEPHRGRRNEPAYVRYIAERIAEIRGVSSEDLAERTFRNACNLFQIEVKS